MRHYILDENGSPIRASLWDWAFWFETHSRRVAETTVDDVWISTVFLGLDHSWGEGPPLIFETMVFGEHCALHGEMDRYTTWKQAEEGHAAMVARVVAEKGATAVVIDQLLNEVKSKRPSE
jgi:hypothetical protein